MLEDEMLPEKYENKEVLWIETEAKHKVWPYSNRSWKRLRRKFTVIDRRDSMTSAFRVHSLKSRIMK